MNIIGWGATNHDDGICLIENKNVKIHYQAERYTRFKRNKATNQNLENKIRKKLTKNFYQNILNKNKYDKIIFALGGKFKTDYLLDNGIINENNIKEILTYNPVKLNQYLKLQDNLFYIDHHQAHAAYAYYTSKFKHSDILAYDGVGVKFQSIFVDSDFKIHDVGIQGNLDFSIGRFWIDISFLVYGLTGSDGSGKGMALAAYGKVKDYILEKFYDWLNLSPQEKSNFLYWTSFFAKHNQDKNFYKDVFASLQYFSTEFVLKNLKKYKTSDNLCISGGCALNGYINEEILKRKLYEKIHVPPAAGDEGVSIGCALHGLYNLDKSRIDFDNPKKIMYLGEEYKLDKKLNFLYVNEEDLFSFISDKISNGYVVGWYQGRCESGPRALGNRSILADPRNPKMKDHLNFKIKNREWYRPFAPSILREEVENWFEINGEPDSPYMTRIMKYKDGMEKLVPAVNHKDNTARIQTVTEDINPRYYKLIKKFFELTNIPILLNTSFNGRGEPIVETPQNAMKCFEKNNIDILVLENYVYFRNNDKNIKPFIEESNVDGNDR